MTAVSIPFNRPSIEGREIELMRAAVEGGHASAAGHFSDEVIAVIDAAIGSVDTLLTTSCTAALEMSAMLLALQPGDTVIVPSYAFVTTALAFAREGAAIKFCDIEDRRLGLDPAHLATLMDDSVRAVVPIHYAGVACDLDGIAEAMAPWPRASLIEDNAHGLFGRFRGRPLGGFGRFSTLSFHETKNFICGEGGALVINEAADVDRAHVLFDKGTNRREFLHGQVNKYSWQDTGSSFGLSDVLAAYLLGQLEQRDHILEQRRRVFDRYSSALGTLAERSSFRLPDVPDECEQAYHMFHVVFDDGDDRNRVLGALNEAGIHATFHYVPLHSSPGGRKVAAVETSCPVTDRISACLLRLPMYTSMTDDEVDRVVATFEAAVRG